MRRMPSARRRTMALTTTTTTTPRFLAIVACLNMLSMMAVILAVVVGSATAAAAAAAAADPGERGGGAVVGGINCVGPTEDGRGWRTVHVPPERVNDDYCDCPYDGGGDEAGTGACSGSAAGPGGGGGWAGVVPEPGGGGHGTKPTHFQCPQQLSLRLPVSRVNDGICDCCDGTDEPLSKHPCPDVCDDILEGERRLLRERQVNFSVGYKLRKADLAEFASVRDAVVDDVRRLRAGLPDLRREIQVLRDRAAEERSGRIAAKRRSLTEMTGGGGGGGNEIGALVRSLTEDEMMDLIVAACHLSGEDPDAKSSSKGPPSPAASRKSDGGDDDVDDSSLLDEYASVAATAAASGDTCIALLRAGVDVGYRWESAGGVSTCYPVFDDGDDADSEDSGDAAADGGSSKPTKKPKKPPRRKDTRLGFDDSYDGAASALAPRRSEFRRHAVAMLDHIQSIYADAEEEHDEDYFDDSGDFDSEDYDMMYDSHDPPSGDDDDVGDAERHRDAERRREKRRSRHERSSSPDESSSTASSKMDPMAIQMTRNELQERVDNVERGNRFAKRAKLLMEGFAKLAEDDSNASAQVQDLRKLTLATIWHARVSSADLAEILHIVLPEFEQPSDDGGEEEAGNSCARAGDDTAFCPPRSTVRAGNGNDAPVNIPPVAIRQAAEERCTQRLLSSDNVCSPSQLSTEGDGEAEGDADAVEVPSNVADGYYGYYKFVPRDEEHDPLSDMFSPLRGDERQSNGDALQEQISELRKREQQTEKEITVLEDTIGGPDRKFGTDGALFGLKDKCFKVEAGKYEYEACPFGQAYQRDVGSKGKGTNLGTYQGFRLDEKTGRPLLAFEKGLKCWQGPHRSASVYISCGSETKLISADEPETCSYALELVSHVACDENYAKTHGLKLE